MEQLVDRVAVVTGGAGGIGRALVEELLSEGMRVVIADVQAEMLDATVAELSSRGAVIGVVTDVTSVESVEALADATWAAYGGCHLLCNNAGVGAPSALVWETTPNDWRWVHGVNVMGVMHGVVTFVPRMIADGEPGHVMNTSSGDGGVEPLPAASVYAASKAAVSTLTECLAAQLESEGTALSASIFYPSGGLLRTGLWESDKTRPADLARERPRSSEPMTIAKLEAMADSGGFDLPWQDLNDLARVAVDGIKAGAFVHAIGLDDMGATLHRRADSIAKAELPHHEPSPLL